MKITLPLVALLMVLILLSCTTEKEIPTFSPTTSVTPTFSATRVPLSTAELAARTFSASYVINPVSVTENTITIRNTSSIALNDLVIELCLMQISRDWQQDIQDITSLLIEPSGTSLEFSKEFRYDEDCSFTGTDQKPNMVQLKLASLPSNQSAYVAIKMPHSVSKSENSYKGNVHIKLPVQMFSGESNDGIIIGNALYFFADSVIYSLGKKWAAADVGVQITCESCPSKQGTYSYSFYKERSVVSCEIYSKDSQYIRMSCIFLLKYYGDPSSALLPEETLYFIASQNSDGENSVTAISKEQYDSNSP